MDGMWIALGLWIGLDAIAAAIKYWADKESSK